MTDERVERRLVAVLAADVAGYSRLMGTDEESMLARLEAVSGLDDPASIGSYSTGDRMLVEFASAVNAVRGAVEVQNGMAEQCRPAAGSKDRVPDWHSCRRHPHR